MSNLIQAYDCSPDERIELFLFWYPNGPVDVVIYIHDIPARKRAKFLELEINPPTAIPDSADYRYLFEEAPGMTNFIHTEYYAYSLPAVPQDVMVDYAPPAGTGSVSRANAIAF